VRLTRASNRWIRYAGAGFFILLAISIDAIAVVAARGIARQHAREAEMPTLKVAGTSEQISRGKAITESFCSGCHSRTGTLTGGWDISKDINVPLGKIVTANLTPRGPLPGWTDGEIFRAIRNSVDPAGKLLWIMSVTNAGHLSDDDIQAVIAYLRALPADGDQLSEPLDDFNLLGLAMLGAGLLPAAPPVITGKISAPDKGATAAYGKYILSYQDCRSCHGNDLRGGTPGQLGPLGSDLVVLKGWSSSQFVSAMRTGIDPDGRQLNEQMPWRAIGRMDDDELTAIYRYILTVL
jgi:mono/diheme cytochrome c family protein